MPKSGTTWLEMLYREALRAACRPTARPPCREVNGDKRWVEFALTFKNGTLVSMQPMTPSTSEADTRHGEKHHGFRANEASFYLFRDPRDRLASVYFYVRPNLKYKAGASQVEPGYLARELPKSVAALAADLTTGVRTPRAVLPISYELLVRDTPSHLQQMLCFLGVALSRSEAVRVSARLGVAQMKAMEQKGKGTIGITRRSRSVKVRQGGSHYASEFAANELLLAAKTIASSRAVGRYYPPPRAALPRRLADSYY